MVRLSSNLQTSAILISTLVSFAIQDPSMALAFTAIEPHPISTLTPSLHNKYGTFNDIARGGGILRSSTTSSNDDNTSEPLTTRQEGISRMKSCYKTAFVFCGVDILARLTETRGGWEKLVISRPSSWVDFADVASSLNILLFGIGLFWVTKLYEQISTSSSSTAGSATDISLATQIMGTYQIMYQATGWSMVALSCRLASKVFVSQTIAPLSVLVVAVCTSFYINTKDKELSNDINSTVSKGIESSKSMEFCSISFLLFAITRMLFWATIGIFGDLPLVIKIIHINKFATPLILYKLLQELNVNFLNATKELSTSSRGDHQLDFSVFEELKEAEASFYGKVTKVLKATTILNIVRYAIPIIKGVQLGE